MHAVTKENAHVREMFTSEDIGNVVFHDYFCGAQNVVSGPQAYLAKQLDPESRIYPKFHDADRFSSTRV